MLGCEWNPTLGRVRGNEPEHAEATVSVARGRWHLCRSCAELPTFVAYEKRVLTERSPEYTKTRLFRTVPNPLPARARELPPAVEAEEVRTRYRRALAHVQTAQGELERAASELAAMTGCLPQHSRLMHLHGLVRKAWYQVEAKLAGGRSRLDSMAVESTLRRIGAGIATIPERFAVTTTATPRHLVRVDPPLERDDENDPNRS